VFKEGFYILPQGEIMKIKYWILVGILALGIVFLAMDNCGGAKKYQRLKGEYNTYKIISKMVVADSLKVIEGQYNEIDKLGEKVDFLQEIIEAKDEDLAAIEDELGELKKNFESLEECQTQYNKLIEAFNLCKSINLNQDAIIFNLNKKYEVQVKVSLEYKKMYESEHALRLHGEKVAKECDKNLKKIRFMGKVKTGIVITMAAVVAYSLLKD